MSIQNGKCPECTAPLVLNDAQDRYNCEFCGKQIVVEQAIQRIKIDGIADFDTHMLQAKRAILIDEDYDKARKYYRQALDLRPEDFKALWGMFLCEVDCIRWAKSLKGYVIAPGDIPNEYQKIVNKYGNEAKNRAPEDVKAGYSQKISEYHYEFTPSNKSSGKKKGCYIATSVYGSYDCPEVWVLRRYRDNDLDGNFFGKLFIKVYYAISPTVVKLFGKTKWFNKMWKGILDKKIAKLRDKGYDDTFYIDKY